MGGRGFVGELTTDTDGVAMNPAPVFPSELTMREPETSDAEFLGLPQEERDRRTIRIGTVDGVAGEKEIRAAFPLDLGR